MATEKTKNFIYIVQASLEPEKCKIGIASDLERRLKEYNSLTGVSKDNSYRYLYTAQLTDARVVETAMKKHFSHLRGNKSTEVYFFNNQLFEDYVQYIESRPEFQKRVNEKYESKTTKIKIVKKTKIATLKEQGRTFGDVVRQARAVKNDEFYTRYEDVEKELTMYPKDTFENKVVFCNCDDAVDEKDDRNSSAFALFFLRNFKTLGLKKLICTHYSGKVDLFHQGSKAYIFTSDGFQSDKTFPKGYNGSFLHPESVRILKEEADIVVTNPPFSKWKEYWPLVINSGKKFIIIGNIVMPVSTSAISFFANKQVRGGFNRVDKYINPKKELVEASGFWFTNLYIDPKDKHFFEGIKFVPLKDIPEKYKYFDDNGILCVDNSYIPLGYKKPFAVSSRVIIHGILDAGYRICQKHEYDERERERDLPCMSRTTKEKGSSQGRLYAQYHPVKKDKIGFPRTIICQI